MGDTLNLLLTYFVEVFSFIIVLIILSGRREARANFSWVMAVIFFPVVGVIAYIIFGNPRLNLIITKRMKKYPFLERKRNITMPENIGRMGTLITKVTGMEPVLSKNLELISDASVKYDRLEEDILKAKRYILMEYYLFRYDKTGRRFADLLIKKAGEGVKVFFMVDGWGSMGLIFSDLFKRLRAAGVETAVFHSPFGLKTASRVNFRNHRKIAVIDGVSAFTGGMNIGDEYAESSKWADAHVRIEGDAVCAVAGYFTEDWLFATGEDISGFISGASVCSGGCDPVHVIPSGPHQTTPMIYDSLYAALNRAESSVDIITPYLVPNQPMIENIRNICRQGIHVRIIVPGKNNHPMAAAAGRSYYEELIESGAQIFETRGTMLHAKIILIDGKWVTLGSANMDARSFKLNFELNLMVYSDMFAEEVSALVGRYLDSSEVIPFEYVRNRNFVIRVFEGVCRTLSPVL